MVAPRPADFQSVNLHVRNARFSARVVHVRVPGPSNDGEETVAHRVQFASTEARQLAPDEGVMPVQERPPAGIAELREAGGRPDDVGEEDRRKNAILLDLGPSVCLPGRAQEALDLIGERSHLGGCGNVIGPGQLDISRAGMFAARCRPPPTSHHGSPAQCSTSVGALTTGSTSRTSMAMFIRDSASSAPGEDP